MQYTIDSRIGLFAKDIEKVSPLAVYEGCTLEPNPLFVKPHDVWVQVRFICFKYYVFNLILIGNFFSIYVKWLTM